jgi:succinoglycan biosynthesis transport protein ExoP
MDEQNESEGGGSVGLPQFLLDPMGVVQRRWRWLLGVLVGASLLAIGAVLLWPDQYEATARLLISSQRIPDEFVRSTIAEGVAEQLNAMVGEALSRDSLVSLIEAHGLHHRPGGEVPPDALLADVSKAIVVEPEKVLDTGVKSPGFYIFAVRFTWHDPSQAAGVANELVTRLIDSNLDRRARQARLTTEFLRREAERAEAALKEQSEKVSTFKEQHRGELPAELATKVARLERLQAQRQALGLRISEGESRLVTLQTLGGEADPRSAALAEIESRLLRERTVHTAEHPNVLALERQVEALRQEISTQPLGGGWSPAQRAVVSGVQLEIGSLRQQLNLIEQEMVELEAQVANTPSREEELNSLAQREEVLRQTYTEALRKVKEAELAESLELAQQGIQISKLEPAMPPGDPKIPLWQLILGAVGGVIGLVAAAGVLLELTDPVVLSRGEIESLTGLALLGNIPRAR